MNAQQPSAFYAGMETVVDVMPAVFFASEFSREFEKAAARKFNHRVPNDRAALFQIAEEVLITMGKPVER